MKLGLIGDCHFTNKTPEKRIDDYINTQKEKLDQAFSIFDKYGCSFIIQTGDLADGPGIPNSTISWIIKSIKDSHWALNMVFGNHDVWGHSSSTIPSSPLSVLESAGVVNLLNLHGRSIHDDMSRHDVTLYGAGFGESIPSPVKVGGCQYNILVTHSMVGNRPLFPGQELDDPVRFLRKHSGYNLVVCGHYHYRFISEYDGRVIVNPGQLLRSTISKFDLEHKPAVMVFDTDTNEVEVVELSVKPPEEVFDLSKPINAKMDQDSFKNLIHKLRNANSGLTTGWKHKLVSTMDRMNCSQECRNVIDKFMEKVGVKK